LLAANLITPNELDQQEEGSPQKALLEWWSSVQYVDVLTVLDSTAPDVVQRVGKGHIAKAVLDIGAALPRIQIQDVVPYGDVVAVRALLISYESDTDGNLIKGSVRATPRTFRMERSGDEWVFGEAPYLKLLFEQAHEPASP
jgi:hypothetical protein